MQEFGTENCSPLGELVRNKRKELGLKQSELCKLLGFSATKMHIIECSELYHPKDEELEEISKVLKIGKSILVEKAKSNSPIAKREKMEECVFNYGVECSSSKNCDKCGWSPMVSNERKEKRRENEQNKRKKREHIVYESWVY